MNGLLRSDARAITIIMALLVLIGLVFIYCASSVYAFAMTGYAGYYVKKQLIGLLLGVLGFGIMQCIPLSLAKRCVPVFFWTVLGLTALTLIPGVGVCLNGSRRWLALAGFSFQPSELLKGAFILYCARILERYCAVRPPGVRVLTFLALPLGCVALVLLAQPDFGLTVTLSAVLLIMLCAARLRFAYLGALVASALPVIVALVYYKPYRLKRFMTFLNPWDDPHGSGFQVIQSLIAIGTGGFSGVGISHSKQKFFYLPMQHTDFIFSIIAEETGFVGACIVILLYILLMHRGLRISCTVEDAFCAYATLGITLLIGIQAFINICVASGLFPTKGIGLPLVSYGNSSLMVHLILMGFLVAVARWARVASSVQGGVTRERTVVHQ